MTQAPALTVGTGAPRADAWTKVQGGERYAVDHTPEGMLWAGVVRAGVAHGRLRGIDATAARALPGVIQVLTAADVPGSNRQGVVHKDMPVLATDRVRYSGDALALVIARDRATLRCAIALVSADIEALPAVFDPLAAMAPDAPQVHDDRPGNLLAQAEIVHGDGAHALARCDVVVQAHFSTPVQAHGFLETENGLAWCEPDGSLCLVVSTQAPFRDRMEIAHALGLPFERIRVISPPLGGGFGGKDGATVQCLLALAALHTKGQPVKMVWDREENLRAGYRRHACQMRYRLGASRAGQLQAVHGELVYDTGAYAHLGSEVMALGMEHACGPYRVPHALVQGWCVHTHNPVAGAMRAFGVCQVAFAIESMMDLLALRLNQCPLDLRRRNALQAGDTNGAGVVLHTSTGIAACLSMLQAHALWRERLAWQAAAPEGKRRGVGLAAVFNAAGYGGKVRDAAIAKVELTPQGQIVVHNAVSDMGQGNASAFVQMAGHVLAQDAGRVSVRAPDTASAYPSGSSSAGRTTYTFGNALISACTELRQRLINRAGLLLFTDDDSTLVLAPGRVLHPTTGRDVTLERLAGFMRAEERVCLGQFVAPVGRDTGTATGIAFGFPHAIFAYAAHLARVEVDVLTGQVAVRDYLSVTDGGQVINPVMFDQQIHGGVAQGLGFALMEDLVTQEGQVVTDDFSTYVMPGALDLPEVVSLACASDEATGPFGMKGVGEVAMNGPLPAVANAIAHATGVRVYRAPITPQALWQALDGPSTTENNR